MKSRLFDRALQGMDVIDMVLLRCAQFTLLPELRSVICDDDFMKFLETFGGTTIQVPSQEAIRNAVIEVRIMMTLQKGDSPQIKKALADEYDLPIDKIHDIQRSWTVLLQSLGDVSNAR